MNKNLKKILIVILVIGIGYFAYTYLSGDSTPTSTGGSLSSSVALPGGGGTPLSTAGANEFSGMLSSINSINIDTTIFSDPGFLALRDHPVVLGTDVVGRPNPFAPVGVDSAIPVNSSTGGGAVGVQSVAVQTLTPAKITGTSAEIGASVTIPSEGLPVSLLFQYDTTEAFGKATTTFSVTRSGATLTTLPGLLPSTRYYVRAVAVQGTNTVTGNTMSFITLAN